MKPLTPVAALRWARAFESDKAVRAEMPVSQGFVSLLRRTRCAEPPERFKRAQEAGARQ